MSWPPECPDTWAAEARVKSPRENTMRRETEGPELAQLPKRLSELWRETAKKRNQLASLIPCESVVQTAVRHAEALLLSYLAHVIDERYPEPEHTQVSLAIEADDAEIVSVEHPVHIDWLAGDPEDECREMSAHDAVISTLEGCGVVEVIDGERFVTVTETLQRGVRIKLLPGGAFDP